MKLLDKVIKSDLNISGTVKSILIILSHHYNSSSGLCNPSVELLAAESGFSTRTVKRAIKELSDKGLIRIVWYSNGRQSNRYHFNKSIGKNRLQPPHSVTCSGDSLSTSGDSLSSQPPHTVPLKVSKGKERGTFNKNLESRAARKLSEIQLRLVN